MLHHHLTLFLVSVFGASMLADAANIRLVDGGHPCAGRVEIYHDGQWGTVCDDSWDLNDAHVVCKELGCGRAVNAFGGAHFHPGSGQIWLDVVGCSGSESSILECSHGVFGKHNCNHGEDASVTCTASVYGNSTPADATNVRLVGGDHSCSGRVEVYTDGQWGTVCDDGWDLNDAKVVCKQLGCGKAVNAFGGAHFLEGSGQIWLNEVGCSGSERSITLCSHGGFGKHNCKHSEDAGVTCTASVFGDSTLADAANIRLIGGGDSCSGRVEIFYDGQWGTVCDDGWDLNDAHVVCKQIGCGSALKVFGGAHFEPGSGQIWLDEVDCSGSERSIVQCSHGGFGKQNCKHEEDAGVVCTARVFGDSTLADTTNVRLVGGGVPCSGRVEVYYSNQWGTVCDDGWDLNDAHVVCKQIGCGSALTALGGTHFLEGSGQIWLDEVDCSGSERNIAQCSHGGIGKHNCKHSEDAGVVCTV